MYGSRERISSPSPLLFPFVQSLHALRHGYLPEVAVRFAGEYVAFPAVIDCLT